MQTNYYLETSEECSPEEVAAFLGKCRIVTATQELECADDVKRKLRIITVVQVVEIALVQNASPFPCAFFKSEEQRPERLLSLTEEEVREAVNSRNFFSHSDVMGVSGHELSVGDMEVLRAPLNHRRPPQEPFLFLPPKSKYPPLKIAATRERKL